MIRNILIIIMILLFVASSFADSTINVKYLTIGQPAPYTGYLFTPEKESEVRLQVLEHDQLVKIVDTQDKIIDNNNEQIKIYQDNVKILNDEIKKDRFTSYIENAIYFGLGVIITGYIATNVNR